MRLEWHQSILFRTGLILVGVFLLLGATTVGVSLHYNRARALDASTLRLSQLLDTVESSASVACFAGDETLANELAAGLLETSEVRAVSIRAGEHELARRQRAPDPGAARPAAETPLVRDIYSPFDPSMRVGQIRLTPNQSVIHEAVRHDLHLATLQMALQLILVACAVMVAVLLQVIRPIQAISDRLHLMDATRGERLAAPTGHGTTEIGLLVADVNRLADRLVQALDEERALRIRREIDERRYHAIFQNAETGIFILDAEGRLTSWNPAFARLLQLPGTTQAQVARSLLDLDWTEPARLGTLLLGCAGAQSCASADLRYRTHEGAERWLNVVLTALGDDSLQGVVHDVTEHKTAEESAIRLAVTDRLTGVANRLGLEQRLHELVLACELNQITGFALVLIDFDDFRRVNEGFGLPAGDEILAEATQRLSACVKGTDIVARLGADQFALGLANLGRGLEVERVAKRVLESLRQHYFLAGSPLRLTASLGIAIHPQDGAAGIPGLLQHAELALSSAKSAGGNVIHFFDPHLATAAQQRRQLENDLRTAIREGRFILYYQPIVDLVEARLVGAEALIRWRHPVHGLVPPDDFIPLAEETGLINDIGLWVLEVAGRQLATWRAEDTPLYLSLNVSARQIPAGLPPRVLQDAAERLGFTPGSLALEITEGILLSEFSGAQGWLTEVRELGFPVYLDDFGTGYSSLSYLKRFAVDRLKIDKGFVRDIPHNTSDRALVEAVVAMARSLAIEVVAEGVEDQEHVRILRELGCRYAQGYHFSRPVPIAEFAAAAERIAPLLAAAAANTDS